jgi:DNA sulfur modification protein DndD
MTIESIEIENFQCFFGKLPPLKLGKGCTVIHGMNGAGKSRLFNAFNWCFMNRYYETRTGWQTASGTAAQEPLISESARERFTSFDVSVKIAFELDDEEIGFTNLTLQRSFKVDKHNISNSEVRLGYMVGNGYTEISDPVQVGNKLDSWFDRNIRSYMWFQGETLDDLVRFEQKDSLQVLTEKISHYRHYESIVKESDAFLRYTKNQLEKEQSNSTSNRLRANELTDNLRTKRSDLENTINQKEVYEHNLKTSEETIEDADRIILKTAKSAALAIQAKEAQAKVRRIGDEREGLMRLFQDQNRSGQLLALHVDNPESFFSGLDRIHALLIARKEELGVRNQTISLEVPSESDLEKLIDAEFCDICGNVAPKGSAAHEHMVHRLNEMRAQSEINSELKGINLFQKEIPEILTLLEEKIKSANRLDLDHERQMKALTRSWTLALEDHRRANDALVGGPDDAGDFETAKLRKATADVEARNSRRNIDNLKERIITVRNQIKELESQLESLPRGQSIAPKFKTRKELAQFTNMLLEQVRNSEKENLLDSIESEANKIYSDLLAGAVSIIATLKISRNDMKMELVDAEGEPVPDPNSANWMAAKVALVTSVLKLAKERLARSYPMISDAATSDMDELNAINYVRVSSEIFEQTIILSKDFSKDSLEALSMNNVQFYTLNPSTVSGKPLDGQNASAKDLKVEILAQS